MNVKLSPSDSMRAAMFGLALAGLHALLMRTHLGWSLRGLAEFGLPSSVYGKCLVAYLGCYLVWAAWRLNGGLRVL